MKVELVNILTIFELTAGKDFKDPAKIESIVVSSIFYSHLISLRISLLIEFLILYIPTLYQVASNIARILRPYP